MKAFLSILLGFLCTGVFAQEVGFFVSADANEIVTGGYVEVSFTLENAQGTSFNAPRFEGFTVISGPNRSSQMSIINGRTSQKQTFSYVLSSDTPGKYTIGEAVIKVGSKTYRTRPLDIEVVKAISRASGSDQEVSASTFIEVEVASDTGFIGQQITCKYVLYTEQDVRSYNFLSIPDFNGFFAREIQNYNERPQRVVREGRQYIQRVLKVFSLFPQQKGQFTIEGASVQLGIPTNRNRSSFFFNTDLKPVMVRSEEIGISVVDLPSEAPESFSGAVGSFYMGTAIDKSSISADDAVTLTFQVRGNGDAKIIAAPKQPFNDLFDIYEPNLLKEEVNVRGDHLEVTKTFEYLMLPKMDGSLTFRPEFTYFDVDSNAYVTILGEEYRVNVVGIVNKERNLNVERVELPPIYTATNFKKKGETFLYSKPYWIANGSILGAFLGLLIVRQVRLKRSSRDVAEVRGSRARKFAMKKLSNAESALKDRDITTFYVQLRKAMMEYLSDRTNHRSAQLTKREMEQIMHENNLGEFVGDLLDLIQKGEQALYASIPPGDEQKAFRRAIEIIQKIESALKK